MMKLLPKTLGTAALLAATAFVAATARKVKSNRAEWSRQGFYGFPLHVNAVSSSGKTHKVTLTSSTVEPLPNSKDEWIYAAKDVARQLIRK